MNALANSFLVSTNEPSPPDSSQRGKTKGWLETQPSAAAKKPPRQVGLPDYLNRAFIVTEKASKLGKMSPALQRSTHFNQPQLTPVLTKPFQNHLASRAGEIRRTITKAWQTESARELDSKLLSFSNAVAELIMDVENWEAPTGYALLNVIKIAPRSYYSVLTNHPDQYDLIPVPTLSTDESGGIRVRWMVNGATPRQLRVNFGSKSQRRSYIYYESGTEHGIRDLDVANLSERIHWLLGE
jgi:hypothetical protein